MSGGGPPAGHPSPHRDRVSILALLFGLAAGPGAWIVQMLFGYGISSYACFPSNAPQLRSPPPGWGGEHGLLLGVNLLCVGVAVTGFLVAHRAWSRSREEREGDVHALIDVGHGRSRFMASCGMLTSIGFSIAILFDAAAIVRVPACWNIL